MKENEKNTWLSSKEAMKKAKIQACDLMHFRTAGKIDFVKKGNAFFYNPNDLEEIKRKS